jgi:prepilin-type N-terminal cleavage/methylation domain-containing protein
MIASDGNTALEMRNEGLAVSVLCASGLLSDLNSIPVLGDKCIQTGGSTVNMPAFPQHSISVMPRRSQQAFTLIELLTVIAITAVLVTAALFFTISYVNYAQQNADKQTLTVLNDALTRYKCEGGNMNALTAGAPVGHVITALQTAITFGGSGGYGHQVLQAGKTYPARSLSSGGQGSSYIFYKFNSYDGYAQGTVSQPAVAPYGGGVGYITINQGLGTSLSSIQTSTGYLAWKSNTGTITGPRGGGTIAIPTGITSITFWSCSAGSAAPSGQVTYIALDWNSNLTGINVKGLTGLGTLSIGGTQITSIDLSQNAALTSFNSVGASNMGNIDVTHCPLLTGLSLGNGSASNTTIDLSKNPLLTYLACYWIPITSLDLSHNTALQTLHCWNDPITSIDLSHNPAMQDLDCHMCQLGTLNITGCAALSSITSYGNPSLTVIGP